MVTMKGLPITDYVAQILVTPKEDAGCTVEIRSRFIDLEWGIDAAQLVSGFYLTGLNELADLMAV